MSSRDLTLLDAPAALASFTADWLAALTGDRGSTDAETATVDLPPTVHEPRVDSAGASSGANLVDSPASGPFRRFEVGAGGYVDAVRIRNDADARTGQVVVTAGGAALLDLTDEFPADGYLDVLFRERDDYRVGVRLDDVERILDLPAERFDGTDTVTDVVVTADGAEITTTERASEESA